MAHPYRNSLADTSAQHPDYEPREWLNEGQNYVERSEPFTVPAPDASGRCLIELLHAINTSKPLSVVVDGVARTVVAYGTSIAESQVGVQTGDDLPAIVEVHASLAGTAGSVTYTPIGTQLTADRMNQLEVEVMAIQDAMGGDIADVVKRTGTSSNNRLVRWASTGLTIKTSPVTCDDLGNVSGVNQLISTRLSITSGGLIIATPTGTNVIESVQSTPGTDMLISLWARGVAGLANVVRMGGIGVVNNFFAGTVAGDLILRTDHTQRTIHIGNTAAAAAALKIGGVSNIVESTRPLHALSFHGNGAAITALNGAAITTGQIPVARMGTGTASTSTYLRGDGTWQTVPGGAHTQNTDTGTTAHRFRVNSGYSSAFGLPGLEVGDESVVDQYLVYNDAASRWVFADSPDGSTPTAVQASAFHGSGAPLTGLNASNLGSGTVPDACFPATLPEVSGELLTDLNADEIASGKLPMARLDYGTWDIAENLELDARAFGSLTDHTPLEIGGGDLPAPPEFDAEYIPFVFRAPRNVTEGYDVEEEPLYHFAMRHPQNYMAIYGAWDEAPIYRFSSGFGLYISNADGATPSRYSREVCDIQGGLATWSLILRNGNAHVKTGCLRVGEPTGSNIAWNYPGSLNAIYGLFQEDVHALDTVYASAAVVVGFGRQKHDNDGALWISSEGTVDEFDIPQGVPVTGSQVTKIFTSNKGTHFRNNSGQPSGYRGSVSKSFDFDDALVSPARHLHAVKDSGDTIAVGDWVRIYGWDDTAGKLLVKRNDAYEDALCGVAVIVDGDDITVCTHGICDALTADGVTAGSPIYPNVTATTPHEADIINSFGAKVTIFGLALEDNSSSASALRKVYVQPDYFASF